jgi:uncharacterized membrane protein YqjE
MNHAGSPVDSSFKERAEAAPPATDEIIGSVAIAFNSTRRVVADLFRLFTLEVRRAGLSLTWMLALGVLAALLMATAWYSLMAALVLWAVSFGLTWIGAMLAIALVNLVTAAMVVFSCVGLSRNLLFPATRRQLAAPPDAA